MSDQKQNIECPIIILGGMEFGRRFDEDSAIKLAKEFLNNNYVEIDTAYIYDKGLKKGIPHSETIIGNMLQQTSISKYKPLISTKVSPKGVQLTPYHIRQQIDVSLSRLQLKCVDILYLHYPDGTVPIIDTLRCINELYKENKFKRFGISNYSAWQVTEIWCLCKKNNWILPTVYQGLYNAVSRDIENELIPCLKHFNISFYAYNILGGGILTGRYKYNQLNNANDPIKGRLESQNYKRKFWYKSTFDAVDIIQNSLNKVYGNNKVSIAEACLRWVRYHSILNTYNINKNGVLIGAGSYNHFISNLQSLENNKPLDTEILKAFENAWSIAKGAGISYVASHTEPFYTLTIQQELQLNQSNNGSNSCLNAIDKALTFIDSYND